MRKQSRRKVVAVRVLSQYDSSEQVNTDARLSQGNRAARCCWRRLSHMQHAQTQQIEVGTSIHLAFEQLESGDLSFYLPGTPGFGEGG